LRRCGELLAFFPRQGKHEKPLTTMPFAVGQAARSNRLHLAITNQNITLIDYPVGKDDRSRKDLVSHRCPFFGNIRTTDRRRFLIESIAAASNVDEGCVGH